MRGFDDHLDNYGNPGIEGGELDSEFLYVGRPPGTSPGWTVWHKPSGLQAIRAVRYKADAKAARDELLATGIDWSAAKPIQYGSPERELVRPVYEKYGLLRQRQLANNTYWPRPKATEVTDDQ